MTAYALLSIKVAHASQEYWRLRLEAQKLYQQADGMIETTLDGTPLIGDDFIAEWQAAANLVDIAAGQYYDVANCMWGRDELPFDSASDEIAELDILTEDDIDFGIFLDGIDQDANHLKMNGGF